MPAKMPTAKKLCMVCKQAKRMETRQLRSGEVVNICNACLDDLAFKPDSIPCPHGYNLAKERCPFCGNSKA